MAEGEAREKSSAGLGRPELGLGVMGLGVGVAVEAEPNRLDELTEPVLLMRPE